ncbi:MAG: 50S ribosomal protein L32 [Candidatus Gracilibacteria bacterium]|jgi:large subunit ribosomal protein L32
MAKHPVPKQKQSKGRSSRRYKTFVGKTQKKLANATKLLVCPKCGSAQKQHNACPSCGFYRGKDILKKAVKAESKITKIKA